MNAWGRAGCGAGRPARRRRRAPVPDAGRHARKAARQMGGSGKASGEKGRWRRWRSLRRGKRRPRVVWTQCLPRKESVPGDADKDLSNTRRTDRVCSGFVPGRHGMLTRKQHDLLLFIHERLKESGIPPSFDEMKDALGLSSKSGIHRLIKALDERGFIRRLPNRARALEVVRLPESLSPGLAGRGSSAASESGRKKTQRTLSPAPAASGPTVPLMGRIAAGVPIEAIQNQTDTIA